MSNCQCVDVCITSPGWWFVMVEEHQDQGWTPSTMLAPADADRISVSDDPGPGRCHYCVILLSTVSYYWVLCHTTEYCVILFISVSYYSIMCHTTQYCVILLITVSYYPLLCHTTHYCAILLRNMSYNVYNVFYLIVCVIGFAMLIYISLYDNPPL